MARQLLGQRWRPSPGPRRARARRVRSEGGYAALVRRASVVEWADRSQRFVERVCEAAGMAPVPRLHPVNVTEPSTEEQPVEGAALRQLSALTELDRALVEALMAEGVLARRSPGQLDEEFAHTAHRLGFRL